MKKTVKVSEEIHQKLWDLKNSEKKDMDQVISFLINYFKENKKKGIRYGKQAQ